MKFHLHRPLFALLAGFSLSLGSISSARAADSLPPNLALKARASAFEAYQGMAAALANDGNLDTRWSAIPGHNTGGWYELDWDQPVKRGRDHHFPIRPLRQRDGSPGLG